jgi:heme/copper-type cytochrome/quinol oxidase subunit 4
MIEPINKPEDNQGKRADQIEFTYKVTFFAIIIILIVTGILWVII